MRVRRRGLGQGIRWGGPRLEVWGRGVLRRGFGAREGPEKMKSKYCAEIKKSKKEKIIKKKKKQQKNKTKISCFFMFYFFFLYCCNFRDVFGFLSTFSFRIPKRLLCPEKASVSFPPKIFCIPKSFLYPRHFFCIPEKAPPSRNVVSGERRFGGGRGGSDKNVTLNGLGRSTVRTLTLLPSQTVSRCTVWEGSEPDPPKAVFHGLYPKKSLLSPNKWHPSGRVCQILGVHESDAVVKQMPTLFGGFGFTQVIGPVGRIVGAMINDSMIALRVTCSVCCFSAFVSVCFASADVSVLLTPPSCRLFEDRRAGEAWFCAGKCGCPHVQRSRWEGRDQRHGA